MAYSVVDVYGSSGSDKDNLFDEIEDDIDMNDFEIIHLTEQVDLGGAATKQYVDTRFPSSSSWNFEGNTVTATQRLGT
jgi:hypothetical protein